MISEATKNSIDEFISVSKNRADAQRGCFNFMCGFISRFSNMNDVVDIKNYMQASVERYFPDYV